MDGRGIGRHQRVEFAEAIGDGAAVETGGEFAGIGVDIVYIADIAVVDVSVVVVLDLHDLVAGGEGPTETLDLALAGGVQRCLEFDVQRAGPQIARRAPSTRLDRRSGLSRWRHGSCRARPGAASS